MRKTKKSSSTTSDSEYCQQQQQQAPEQLTASTTPPPPKLDDGFYEIERIRRKRIRKGELQYLIKWRGWPETANTWEPLHNLQSVPDLIHAFEQSLKSGAAAGAGGGGKHHCSKGRRATTLPPPSQPLLTTNTHPTTVQNPPTTDSGIHAAENLATHFHQTVISTPNDAQSNVNGGDPLLTDRTRGAKRRKPASVKRFKKEECASQTVDANNTTANDISVGGKVEPGWSQTACNIVKILKPIGYSASLSTYMQDVSVTFMAMRSDGTEVMVDNKYLKTNNPLLLINFYEQHLRYNPTS